MEKLQKIETIEPNKDITEMTRMIIKQNDEILKMNAVLIQSFSSPVMYLSAEGKKRLANKAMQPTM